MKKFLSTLALAVLFLSVDAYAQLRGDVSTPFDYQGSVINASTPTVQTRLNNFFSRIEMNHSYSMNFSSFGGSYQTLNAYTNSMSMQITDRLDARLDVSLLHSPFGGNSLMGAQFNEPQIRISNAELNYKLGDNASIHLQYRQIPGNMFGYSPFGYGYNPFNRNYRGF